MKILFVAPPESIHSVRWISQIIDQGWEIHLFPCVDVGKTHPAFKNITVHHSVYSQSDNPSQKLYYRGLKFFAPRLTRTARGLMNKYFPNYHARHLARVIRKIKPDVIHSLEILLAGRLVYDAKKYFQADFPIWITTSWGLDVYFFGRLKKNFPKVKEVLSTCDYFSCECHRDAKLAENYGLKPDQVVAVYPNTGGFDLKKIKSFRAKGKTSARRLIMLKGYQNLYGRALVALRAMERCHELLKDYKIMIYGMPKGSSLEIAAELFSQRTGVPIEIIPFNSPHETILKYHGKSRISISTNAADGVNTAFLESIVMGSFPIQSNTACADEWVQDGKTGFIVPPEDPEVVEVALRKALTNDRLVDLAAKLNWETTLRRLNFIILKTKTIELYEEVVKRGKYPRK